MSQPSHSWAAAASLLARWLGTGERIDRLMEGLPSALSVAERARCQHLVYGVVRHAGRIEASLARLVAHSPRFITKAVLMLAGFELIEATAAGAAPDCDTSSGSASSLPAKIIHHAVEQAKGLSSPAEARLVNAVARKLETALREQRETGRLVPPESVAEYYSHPDWLVRRWFALYGADSTRELLRWNQRPAPVFARVRERGGQEGTAYVRGQEGTAYLPRGDSLCSGGDGLSSAFKPTSWVGFFEVVSGRWAEVEPLLKARAIYVQDPSTRIAVDLLAPLPEETVLDLCAGPGGKSLLIADRMGKGKLVACDLPGQGMERLRENLSATSGVAVTLVEGDILREGPLLLRRRGLPEHYPAVLIDVPCSNTGVMRHRIDVKWRLRESDFRTHGRQQLALLAAAASWVEPGGRLVYSTCSIDPEENEQVVEAFLKKAGAGFVLEERRLFFPWVEGHDGGGAFRLRRR